MKRLLTVLLLALSLALVLAAGLFLASGYWGRDRDLWPALGDFGFVPAVFFQHLTGGPSPVLSDQGYQAVLGHLERGTDISVRRAARERLADWGAAVVPRLLESLHTSTDPVQRVALVDVLGRIGDARAVAPLVERLAHAEPGRVLAGELVTALGAIGSADALPALVGWYRATQPGRTFPAGQVLRAIGRCGGMSFLLERVPEATPELAADLADALALTGEARAVEILVGQLQHPAAAWRAAAARALGQMGPIAVPAVMDRLVVEADDYLRASLVDEVLSQPDAATDPRVVPWLASLLEYPPLASIAARALARIDTADSVARLVPGPVLAPREVVTLLGEARETGSDALPGYLEHPDRYVRMVALDLLARIPDARLAEQLEARRDDPEEWIRREADDGLLHMAKFQLWDQLNRLAGVDAERRYWSGWHRPLGHYPGSVRVVQAVVLVLSALIGTLLVLNLATPFETYRVHLVCALLVLAGLGGGFLVFDESYAEYRLALAASLLLLIGYHLMQRDSRPEGTGVQMGFMGGAALWLLVPSLLWLGLPVLAEALRLGFQSAPYMLSFAGAMLVLALLLLEDYVVPRRLVPRSARANRRAAAAVSVLLFTLVAWPLWGLLQAGTEIARRDGAAATLLLAGMAGLLAYQLYRLLAVRPGNVVGVSAPPPGLGVVEDGERITVRLPGQRLYRGLWLTLPGLALLMAAAWSLADMPHAADGLVGSLVSLLIGGSGALLAALAWSLIFPRRLLQFDSGRVRSAVTLLGLGFEGGTWRRLARVEALEPAQREWLWQLQQRTAGEADA